MRVFYQRRQTGWQRARFPRSGIARACLLAVALGATDFARAAIDEPIGVYLKNLEELGRLRVEDATDERLRELLLEAEADLIRGDARAATTRLFAIVESPRFAPLSVTPAYQNAEFLLGRALFLGRAQRAARRYLGRVLGRGPTGSYFVPAVRTLVDLALQTRQFEAVLAEIEGTVPFASLPEDSRHEVRYLRGRLAYARRVFDEASAEFRQVGRSSRLYPAALYFRGLAAVEAGAFDEARDAFCAITEKGDQDRLTFNVDERFFRLKDLARLALGRLAHERDAYDEAYYFYFSVPDDSPHLASALHEAAWSMLQKGEFRAARAFADQFERLFPDSPLVPEVRILRAHLAVKTCAFERARKEANVIEKEYAPLFALATQANKDAALRDRLVDRLLVAAPGTSSDDEGRLLRILKLDDDFADLVARIADLDAEIAEATASVRLWRELGVRAQLAQREAPALASAEAVQLVEDVLALLDEVQDGSPEWRDAADLLLQASLLAYPAEQAGPYAREAEAAQAQARELVLLRSELIAAARANAQFAIREAQARLRRILAEARLVHIDAVVGKKKSIEVQIKRLTDGTLTPGVAAKLIAEGVLRDDEIYWPYEGEMWADEYENYR